MSFTLTTRAKESFKLALATVLAYGIAMAMSWDKPYWAALAVAVCSLSSVGASLSKGWGRFLGTIVGALIAFILIGLFPQERWLFMLALSFYITMCTYLMGAGKYQYFFNVSGFVCATICFEGGVNATNVFNIAIIRMLETGMGVLVYTFVNTILWPQKSIDKLKDYAKKTISSFIDTNDMILSALDKKQDDSQIKAILKKQTQLILNLSDAYELAKLDSSEVWNNKEQWLTVKERLTAINSTYALFFKDLRDLSPVCLDAIAPKILDTVTSISRQLNNWEQGIKNNETVNKVVIAPLAIPPEKIAKFSLSDQGVILALCEKLNGISSHISFSHSHMSDRNTSSQFSFFNTMPKFFELDYERIIASARVFLAMWAAYLIWIYFRVPGDILFVMMTVSIAMAFSSMPYIPPALVFVPAVVASLFASVFYIFIMPSLSGFSELAGCIIIFVFLLGYLFYKPKQAAFKSIGLTMFISITGISNQQTYSFFSVSTTVLMFALVIVLICIIFKIPQTTSPHRVFLLLSKRYFKQLYHFIDVSQVINENTTHKNHVTSPKKIHNPSDTVNKLSLWSSFIDFDHDAKEKHDYVDEFISCTQDIVYRFENTVHIFTSIDTLNLNSAIRESLNTFILKIQDEFLKLSKDLSYDAFTNVKKYIDSLSGFSHKNVYSEEFSISDIDVNGISSNNIAFLVSSFRSLTVSIESCREAMKKIPWNELSESRF